MSASESTSIWEASKSGKLDRVRTLLDRGQPIDAKSKLGSTPLRLAASFGHKAVVSLLLERKASPVVEDSHGKNALFEAASHGRISICALLIRAGSTGKEWAAHEARKQEFVILEKLLNKSSTDPDQAQADWKVDSPCCLSPLLISCFVLPCSGCLLTMR